MRGRSAVTQKLAGFIAGLTPEQVPTDVLDYAQLLVFDGIGALVSATHPAVTAAAGIGDFAEAHGGSGPATLIGRGRKVDVVNAVLANGTLGYASDFEPHHPEAILHPMAVVIPTALALSELRGRSGRDMLTAIVLGCEMIYRVSMALNPRELYDLGFHPSAIAGTFGAASAAAYLLELDREQCVRTLGLAALQTSGLLAWQDDPKEDARPFQMGMAARNGVTAALLAGRGFGAPDRIFDGGHTVLKAYSRVANAETLTDRLGEAWDGISELAVKPYPCVSFLHPALDALEALLSENTLKSSDIRAIDLRFPNAGAHCVDANPLKGHNAQYILPVRAAMGRLSYLDLFYDRRLEHAEVARLAAVTTVTRDFGELDQRFPEYYASEITLRLTDGREIKRRSDVARGYPECPLSAEEIEQKFSTVVSEVADENRRKALAHEARNLIQAETIEQLAALLAMPALRRDDR